MAKPIIMGFLLGLLACTSFAQQSDMAAAVNRVSHLTAQDISSLQEKSDSGDPQAQFILGLAYAMGAGVKHDSAEAFRWMSSE